MGSEMCIRDSLFILDPLGSVIEDDYAAIGTGAPIAIGIIESLYKKEIDLDDGKKLAYRAVKAAIERDAASGDGIDLVSISGKGIFEEFKPLA